MALTALSDATADRIQSSAREASTSLVTASDNVVGQLKTASYEAQHALSSAATSSADTLKTTASDSQKSLVMTTDTIVGQLKTASYDIQHAVASVATNTAEAIKASSNDAQAVLLKTTEGITAQLRNASADAERIVGTSGASTSDAIRATAHDAKTALAGASDAVAQQLKSASTEIERTLTTVAVTTADQLKSTVADASSALVASTGTAGSQLRSLASDVERALAASTASAAETLHASAQSSQSALAATSSEAATALRTAIEGAERSVSLSAGTLGSTLTGKADEIAAAVRERTEQLAQMLDDKRSPLVTAVGSKSDQLIADIGRATDDALRSIEGKGFAFTQAMMGNSNDLARMINTAGEVAAGAVNKSLKDIEQSTRNAIEQSRQVSIAAVNEMQETSKLLRTDTVALFERLREGNILLQEVLTGAHANLSTLEQALVSRVAEFVSTLNDVSSRTGATTRLVDEQISTFNNTTKKALADLSDLASHFDQHGRVLTEAARMIDESNTKTNATVADKKTMLDNLVTTLDLRTTDLDQRLSRFNSLLEESMQAAEARAREIARVVADTASNGSTAITQQFEAVRSAAEEERRLTSEAMHEIYQQGTQEADAMLSQAAERFASIVQDMRQMASEMQRELETTRTELRRGVLEMPQEAAESTAQMRKVIVDQIEALAELNRIVARHGRGLDVTATPRTIEREAEPAMAGGSRIVPRQAGAGSASSLPPPDIGIPPVAPPRRTEAPPVSPAASDSSRDGWLSDLLSRADDDTNDMLRQRPQTASRPAGGGSNPLESLASDIARLLDRDMAADMWDRYQRGERKAFTKRLYTPAGQKTFDEISRKYRAERNFKQTVDRYIVEFERFLDDVARNDRDPNALRTYLTSETGLVYTLLAHAAGRLG
jgi:hypothetical protein